MNDHLGKVFKILYFPIKSENLQLHTHGYPFYDSKMQNFENCTQTVIPSFTM